MNKFFSLLLAMLLCVCVLAACAGGAQDENPAAETSITVTAADGFENYGYVATICGESGFYEFSATAGEGSETIWSVYLLDEEFTDAARYIPHAYTASLEGSGMLYIESGKYIYTSCSNNSMSAGEAEEGASYTFKLIDDSQVKYSIHSENSFSNCGFTSWVCTDDGNYTVSTSGASVGVTWTLYVLDEEFTDADRFIPQAYTSTLEGDGVFSATAGQYIYIQCSANDFTSDGPVSGAALVITNAQA